MLGGYALLGIVPVMVKGVRAIGWTAAHTVVARFAIACLCVGLVVALRRRGLTTNNRPLLLLRGVLGGAAVLLFFSAVQLAGAGPGTLLNYTYPVWANVFGVLFTKQRPPSGFWVLLLLAMVGVYLIVDPRFGGLRLGELFGVASAMLAGGAVLCIKQLRRTDESLVIIWSFSVVGLLFALPVALLDTVQNQRALPWGDHKGWLFLTLTGVFSFFGHVYFTRGYTHTTLQLGSVLALTVPIIAVVCGWLFLDEPLSPAFLTGGGLILVSTAWLGLLESRRASAEPIT